MLSASEIVQDPSQLSTFLNKCEQQDVLEIMLRTLLDWPTNEMKTKLIELLAQVQKHGMIFSITLSDNLNRLYNVKGLSNQLLNSVAKLISSMCSA
jgi:hypothetical protein